MDKVDRSYGIVNLGDGRWVALSELVTIMWLTSKELDNMDEAPVNCEDTNHVHVVDLVAEWYGS